MQTVFRGELGWAVLMSDKIYFGTRKITGDNVMMKGLIHQEDVTILCVYVPHNKALKCTK